MDVFAFDFHFFKILNDNFKMLKDNSHTSGMLTNNSTPDTVKVC